MIPMKLTEAVRVLFYTDSRGANRLEAVEPVREELEKLGRTTKFSQFKKTLGDDCIEEEIENVLMKALVRKKPLLGTPPPNEVAAKAFLQKCLWNRLLDRARRGKRLESLDQRREERRAELPGPRAPATPPDLPWWNPNEHEPDEILQRAFDALSSWTTSVQLASAIANEQGDDADVESRGTAEWQVRREAVLAACHRLRSRSERIRFAAAFQRLVRIGLGLTSMEQEVDREIELHESVSASSAPDRRKIRMMLDQQNSRTLKRIAESLVGRGVSAEQVRSFIEFLAVRGYRRRLEPESA